ncbi:MAG: ABC transporter ATP-binding protein [Lachnospiraceae bacterium]|nr:ABC transporter ATP-binding protein [Lachnospiraceae bacterium]
MNENSQLSLEIQSLRKSFRRGKKQVLQDITLQARGGQCIGILGANGCGKSTLLSILAGIQRPDSGNVLLNGVNLLERKMQRNLSSLVGFVPQEPPLMAELTAYDNLKLWYCQSPLSLERELEEGFLATLGIPDFLTVSVRHMSGGMKKRLSIGCSIAMSPRVLLLDEPGAALDLLCKEYIETYLRQFRSQGNLILIATHEEREIALCDQLFLLKNGVLSPLSYEGDIHQIAKTL